MSEYLDFLSRKAVDAPERGLRETPDLAAHLFPFQAHSVDFCLRMGTAGLFLDTGLGKTECQLEWCRHAQDATNGRSLILVPLAVAGQTKRRADRWGYEARVIRDQSEAGEGINICNYDRLERLDPEWFGAVALDEASILKSFTGKTTRALINGFRGCRFKLVATATPAPNDHMELGNYAEFLDVMAANEMLSRFFINDTSMASQHWRLKGHAETPFWDWMASWARMAEKPSDLGDCDDGFILPPFIVNRHLAGRSEIKKIDGDLFGGFNMSATSLHDIKRQTSVARANTVAKIVSEKLSEKWLLWCDTNYEADAIARAVPSAVDIRGSMSIDQKEEILEAFGTGDLKHLIAKPSMCGFGLDWAHCSHMAFIGRSYSYETWYQAIRRCWRFGQKRPVHVHLVVAEGEGEIGRVIDRKSADHQKMRSAMTKAMKRASIDREKTKIPYIATHKGSAPAWL